MAPRLCLVNPLHPYLKQPKAQAPLGLLYVAASVRERGFPVEFVDLSDRHFGDEFENDIPEAEIYGITGTVLDKVSCHTVAAMVKRRDKAVKVVLGGPITLSSEHIDRDLVDSIVVGEGEHAILDILRDYPRLDRVYKAKRIEDLDSLPIPARDLLEGQLGGDVFANRETYFEGGSTVFVTSRGCPYSCVFCASPKIWGRKIHFRNPAKIAEEIDHVVERHGVRQFRFSDDTVTSNAVRLGELCEHLKGKDIAWRASIRARPNGLDMFRMMKEAGCVEVCFGIESGDQEVLHVLQKKTTVEDNRNAVINAKTAGLAVRILFMCGTPGETRKTVGRNIEYLESVGGYYDTIACTNFVPLPGTAVAEEPAKHGCEILSEDIDKFNLCLYDSDGEMRNWPNLVRPVALSLDELTDAKRRMIEYVLSTGKSNQG